MALVLKDRISETTTTSGTGTITLAGARVGFQGFSAIGDGNTTYYCITDGAAWEVGLGTYTSTGNTLARTTVYSNSNGNTSPITLSAGTKNVFSPMPANGIITVNGSTIQVPGSAILPVANGGTGANTLTSNNVILGNGTSAVQFVAPGTAGNVLTSNGSSWASSAPAGGGGKVLQIVNSQYKATQTIQSATYVATNVTGTITPSSSSSRVLVCANVFVGASGGLEGGHFRLYRDGSLVTGALADAAGTRDQTWFHVGEQSGGAAIGCGAAMYLDSPATTSATTYTLYARCYSGTSGTVIKINASENDTDASYVSRTVSAMTLWEIAA